VSSHLIASFGQSHNYCFLSVQEMSDPWAARMILGRRMPLSGKVDFPTLSIVHCKEASVRDILQFEGWS
jgi:hypothetical protein